MWTRSIGVAVVALLAGCEGVSKQTLQVVQIEARVVQRCDAGSCAEVFADLRAPHCGYDLSAFDAGTVKVYSAAPPRDVTGAFSLETTLVRDGGAEFLTARRGLLGRAQVIGAYDPTVLYAIGDDGVLFVTDDAGTREVREGTLAFAYAHELGDGGVATFDETHEIVSRGPLEVEFHDSSSDPFYGCCGHAGWAGPCAAGLAFSALAFIRRRARPNLS